ncbi:hypothetical protein [Aggregatibacter actinomycetemcomitans]|nr:hypothetical protein [Aggregatibacter actinomycetemcomitans]
MALSWVHYQSASRIFQQQTSEAILRTLLQKNQVAHMAFYLSEG